MSTLDATRMTFRTASVLISTCALAAVFAAVSISWSSEATISLPAVLVLCALAIIAANMDIEVSSRVGISGDVMLLTAALAVFRTGGLLLGPVLVAACGGFDFNHVRRREWSKIAMNSAIYSLSILVGALVFSRFAGSGQETIILLLGTALSSAVFLALNTVLMSWGLCVLGEQHEYLGSLRQAARFNSTAYPLSLIGFGLGWAYIELGAIVVPLIVVPLFIARRTFASYLDLKAAQEQTIETLILALEAKDRYTAGHAQRVAMFSAYIGEELHFSPRRMERLRYAALMHDIGKLVVPNQLLNKPGRLTESEFERVRRHESVSVELLRRIDFLAPIAGDTTTEAATAAAAGSGLLEPAIIHIADAFDAMTSTRSYRKALPQEVAFEELRKGAGTQFHEACVEALIAAIERRGEHYGDGHEDQAHEWAVAPPEAGTGSAGLGDLAEDRAGAS